MKRTRLRLLLLCSVLSALVSLPGHAQDHPLDQPGFVPNKAYDVHDYDSVNTMNGNLIVSIPIGPSFHVNGGLSYGLALHYNSKLWYWQHNPDPTPQDAPACQIKLQNPRWDCGTAWADPLSRFNAAFGWTLSLGRLLNLVGEGVVGTEYEDPDGATHKFDSGSGTTSYSTDGSYLRMIQEDGPAGNIYIDSRDGVRRTFTSQNVSSLTPGTMSRPMLTQIKDAVGNHVDIAYTSGGLVWTITDVGRVGSNTIVVTFASGGVHHLSKLTSVSMPGPTGNVTYTFTTVDTDVHFPDNVTTPGVVNVPLLTRIHRPIGPDFVFTTDGSVPDAGANGAPAYDTQTDQAPGCLLRMTVPTGAIYDWRYDEGYVPRTSSPGKPGIEHPIQVITRTIVDPADPTNVHDTSAVWRYNYGAFNGHNCQTLTTYPFGRAGSVVKPDGTVDVSYYSLQDKQPCDVVDQFNNTWDRNDLGLPFTKGVTLSIPLNSPPNATGTYLSVGPANAKRTNPADPTDVQYLSSQTYSATGTLLRSRYVRYEGDPPRSEGTRPNARAVTETSYQEDATCGSSPAGPCYSTLFNSDYRNFGNYATSITKANDLGGNQKSRTVFRNLPSTLDNFVWVLDDPSEECTLDEAVTGISTCLGRSGTFTTLFDYDRQHNLLNGKRVLRRTDGILDGADILTRYFYEDTGDADNLTTNGNLTTEQIGGGDGGTLGTDSGSPFSSFVPSMTIRHHHDYSNNTTGALTGSRSYYDGFAFSLNDFTVQAETGLIIASKDSAGLQTDYTYDDLGRLHTVTTPAKGLTTYTYNDSGNPISISAITSQANSPFSVLKQALYEYDYRGRFWHDKSMVNGAWSTRTTRYDLMSRIVASSQLVPSAVTCDTAADNCTHTTYDSLGRPLVVTDADGLTTTYGYTGGLKTTRAEQLSLSTSAIWVEESDALGRLASVHDPVNTTGSYTYDTTDRLLTASVSDGVSGHSPQLRTFAYDGRGFLTSETHPENGQVFYTYDAAGKIRSKSLPASSTFDLQFQYDGAERVTSILSRTTAGQPFFQVMKEYTYDGDGSPFNHLSDYSLGKLTSATRHNYQGTSDVKVVEKYHYADMAGRLTDRITQIWLDSTLKQSFSQSAEFNELGLVTKTSYPKCDGLAGLPTCQPLPWPSVARDYVEGRVTNVEGFATMTYAANEMLNTISHRGNAVDTITPDAKYRSRPASITVVGPDAVSPPCDTPQFVSGLTPQTITSGNTVTMTISVTGKSPISYQWYQDSTVISGATSSSYTTPTLTATHNYSVTASNSCGSPVSSNTTITVQAVCPMPQITTDLQDAVITANQSVTLAVAATGQNLTYTWFETDQGMAYSGPSSSPTLHTLPLNRSMKFYVIVHNGCGQTVTSRTATITVSIPAVQNVVAIPVSTGVLVTWTPLPALQYPVTYYSIERRAPNGFFVEIIQRSSTTSAWTDTGVNMGFAAAYRVRPVEVLAYSDFTPLNYGSFSNVDSAARYNFSPLPSQISAAPLEQLRQAVNEIRSAAGLSNLDWTTAIPDDPMQSGAVAAASHLIALRVGLNNGLAALSVPITSYVDPGLPSPTLIKAAHLTQLQDKTK